jgi:hypothetical protein
MNPRKLFITAVSHKSFFYLMLFIFLGVMLIFTPRLHHIDLVKPISSFGTKLFLSGKGLPDNFHLCLPYFLLTSLYYITASLLGMIIMTKILMKRRVSVPVGLAASFLPGYLIVIGINRVLTIAFTHEYAPYIIVIFLCALAVILYIANTNSVADYLSGQSALTKSALVKNAGYSSLLMVLIFTALIWRIQLHVHAFCGDSTAFLTEYLAKELGQLNMNSHAPLFDLHYDEFIFNYPLIYISRLNVAPLLYFWIIAPVGLISSGCLMYSLFRYYGTDVVFAILAAVYLILGSHFLNPMGYINIFDSGNPLALNLHIGRIATCIFPLLFLIFFFNDVLSQDKMIRALFFMLIFIPFCFGISSLSFHFVIYSLGLALVSIIMSILKTRKPDFPLVAYVLSPLLILLMIVPFLTLFYINNHITLQGLPIIIAACIGVLGLFIFFLPIKLDAKWHAIAYPALFILCVIVSSALFGNNFVLKFKSVLQGLGEHLSFLGYNPYSEILSRDIIPLKTQASFFKFYFAGPVYFAYNYQLFIFYFGFITGITLLAFFSTGLFLKNNPEINEDTIRNNKLFIFHILLYSILFSLSIFITCHISVGVNQWFLTRLIEVPFYGMLMLSLLAIRLFGHKNVIPAVYLFLIIWTVSPFIYNNRIEQLILNFQYFVDHIAGVCF